jgi:hydrogenase nickel incorporation protein HypB
MILNKTDLLPYLDFNVAQCIDYARRVNPGIKVLHLSATGGEGLDSWYQWMRATRQVALIGQPEPAIGAGVS